jgi:hypothetical protein
MGANIFFPGDAFFFLGDTYTCKQKIFLPTIFLASTNQTKHMPVPTRLPVPRRRQNVPASAVASTNLQVPRIDQCPATDLEELAAVQQENCNNHEHAHISAGNCNNRDTSRKSKENCSRHENARQRDENTRKLDESCNNHENTRNDEEDRNIRENSVNAAENCNNRENSNNNTRNSTEISNNHDNTRKSIETCESQENTRKSTDNSNNREKPSRNTSNSTENCNNRENSVNSAANSIKHENTSTSTSNSNENSNNRDNTSKSTRKLDESCNNHEKSRKLDESCNNHENSVNSAENSIKHENTSTSTSNSIENSNNRDSTRKSTENCKNHDNSINSSENGNNHENSVNSVKNCNNHENTSKNARNSTENGNHNENTRKYDENCKNHENPEKSTENHENTSKKQKIQMTSQKNQKPKNALLNTNMAEHARTKCLCGRTLSDCPLSGPERAIAAILSGFAVSDGGMHLVRTLEDSRLAGLARPLVSGLICSSLSPPRWYRLDGFRWVADDGLAFLYRWLNERVLGVLMAVRRHVCDYGVSECNDSFLTLHRQRSESLLRAVEVAFRRHDSRRRVISELGVLSGVFVKDFEELLDANPDLVGFNNCVFDLQSGCARAGRPEDYMSMTCGYDFPLSATPESAASSTGACVILSRLTNALPSPDSLSYLLHLLAQTFTCDGSNVVNLQIGDGANSKSAVFSILLKHLLGAYYLQAEPELLCRARPSTAAAAPDVLALQKKRAVVFSEGSRKEGFITSFLKRMTGGETLAARNLFESKITAVKIVATLIYLTNVPVSLPHTVSDRDALSRRFRVLEWPVRFFSSSEDPNFCSDNPLHVVGLPLSILTLEFANHAGDFAAYLLLCILPAYQRHGLPVPAAVAIATTQYLAGEDAVLAFLGEMQEVGRLKRVAGTVASERNEHVLAHQTALWDAFKPWFAARVQAGEACMSSRPRRVEFMRRLSQPDCLGEMPVSAASRRQDFPSWEFKSGSGGECDVQSGGVVVEEVVGACCCPVDADVVGGGGCCEGIAGARDTTMHDAEYFDPFYLPDPE